jgi:FKBP-type peptidyl-prolyl cis-trans isomerase
MRRAAWPLALAAVLLVLVACELLDPATWLSGGPLALSDPQAIQGADFMASNANAEGVVTTASGLQYRVIVEGDGPRPTARETVNVHYTGKFLDGTVFDSSVERGQPISFPLNGVIAGWTEGVQLMPVGSTYEFWIPPGLAYGTRGAGGVIPPNATLYFEVQLLGIEGR